MKQQLILLLILPAVWGFAPTFTGRYDVALNAKRGKGLSVPSSGAGEARGLGGGEGTGE